MSTTTGSLMQQTIVVKYDHEARAQYQYVSDKPIARTVERPDGTIVDLAADGSIVGIETLH